MVAIVPSVVRADVATPAGVDTYAILAPEATGRSRAQPMRPQAIRSSSADGSSVQAIRGRDRQAKARREMVGFMAQAHQQAARRAPIVNGGSRSACSALQRLARPGAIGDPACQALLTP